MIPRRAPPFGARRPSSRRRRRRVASANHARMQKLLASVSPYFLFFTGFVALNMIQSAFTRWCPMMWLLRRLGVPDEARCRITG
jgi:hypothetical protein